ncbi:MAG TPA: hypothetical protein VGT44_21700 [Ktedonobacteraceae bacterium]|nr:hypothetical protein [Ktedonobacteraceae bacterium]
MDPTMLCLDALIIGAGANTRYSSITPDSTKALYNDLKTELQQRIAGQPEAATLLFNWDEHCADLRLPMQEALDKAHITEDEEVVQMARKLLKWLQPQQALQRGYIQHMTGNIQDQAKNEYLRIITK